MFLHFSQNARLGHLKDVPTCLYQCHGTLEMEAYTLHTLEIGVHTLEIGVKIVDSIPPLEIKQIKTIKNRGMVWENRSKPA